MLKRPNRPIRTSGPIQKRSLGRKANIPVQNFSTNKGGLIASISRSEAFWVVAASSLLYTITFSVQKSYLGAHGIEAVFVETDIDRLLLTATIILGLAFTTWSNIGLLPTNFTRKLFALLYLWWITILALLIFYWLFQYFGFAWGVLAFGVIAVSLTAIEIRYAVLNYRRGRGILEQFEEGVKPLLQFDDNTLRTKVLSGLPPEMFTLLILFLIAGQSVGPLVGRYAAWVNTEYHVLVEDDRQYILVSEFQDGFVFVEVKELNDEISSGTLTDRIVWISTADLSLRDLSTVKLESILRGEQPQHGSSLNRVSFDEFIGRLKFWSIP